MKSIFFSVIVILLGFNLSTAQADKYTKEMEKAIAKLDKAQTSEEFVTAANGFERIANVEKEEWLPLYYKSYAHMQAAVTFMGDKDMKNCMANVNQAQETLKAAEAIAPNESEISALQAYVYQGFIWEDVQTNGAKYTPMIYMAVDKALALNPENPRAYMIKGQNLLYTPEFYGGGAKNALPILKAASAKFDTFKPASSIHPNWGKGRLEQLLKVTEGGVK